MILKKGGKTINLKSEAQIAAYKNAGYLEVEEPNNGKADPFKGMSVEQLTAYAQEKGIELEQATSKTAIIKKIQEAEKAAGADD